jgi:DNA invertase Pin-like site-specific DNA recombinase
MTKRAIGYVRVSTTEQHLSPEAQRAELERWCTANDAELVAVFVAVGVSGGAPLDKRTVLLAAVDALTEHGADVLLVAKRDRLARDTMVAAMVERLVERAGASVVSAAGAGNGAGPEAQLMRHMVDAFAEYERALIKARTRAALAVKRSRGEKTGGALPFGFRLADDGRTLLEDAAEQRIVARIQRLRAEGVSFRRIAAALNDDNEPARGARWYPTTVQRLVARAA